MRTSVRTRRGFPHKRRWPLAVATGAEAATVTFPASPLKSRVWIALGADLTASHLTWNWLNITERARHDLGISVTVGRGNESSRVNPARATLKVGNTDGHLTRRNAMSPYFGLLARNTPIWIETDPGSGYVTRFQGYINEWPTRWADQSGTDAYVTLQCAGVMRRLAQGENLKSAMFRSISGRTPGSLQPIAYWPMEDGSEATSFGSAVTGVSAVTPSGSVTFASNGELPGSQSLPSFATNAEATFNIPAYTSTGVWMIQLAVNAPTAVVSDTVIATIYTNGEGLIVRYELELSPSGAQSVNLNGYDSAGTLQISSIVLLDGSGPANPLPADFYGNWWSFRISEKTFNSGTEVLGSLYMSGTVDDSVASQGTNATGATSTIRSVRLNAAAATDGIRFGHLGVHADAALIPAGSVTQDVLATVGALRGWSGEQAHNRIKRLCREEGVQARALAGSSAQMGAQGRGTLLDVLRECETADGGVLYEHEFGIAYQALSERYNQPVSLALNFDSGHIIMPTPADDDQRLRNEWTVSRSGSGSFATYRDAADVAANGVYDDSATVNVQSDSQLADIAAWKVHIGIVDEDRWPGLPIKLHGSPDLIPSWLAMPLGARLTIDNPPDQMPQDQISLILEGYTERWDQVTWDLTLQTSPASPYTVGVYGSDPHVSRYDSDNSSLASAIDSSATSLSVATDSGHAVWTTSAAEFPFDINIGGERMTVTTISSSTSPQTFTVTRSVNGVVKSHAAAAKVSLWEPARYAL